MENAAVQDVGEAQGRRRKRLFGLWLICVCCIWGVVFNLEAVLRATALGVPVFVGFAALSLALALGLWVRARWAWWVTIVLNAISGAASLVYGLSVWKLNEPRARAAVIVWINLAIVLYLLWRRRYFLLPREERPRLRSRCFAVTCAVLLALGVCYVLVLNVDDRPLEFPELALEQRSVPAEENGYTVLLEIDEQGLYKPPDDANILWQSPEPDSADFGTWLVEARQAVADNAECLERIEAILARPHFVFARPVSPMLWSAGLPALTRRLARLLAMKATVELGDARPAEAMKTALDVVTLGQRYAGARGAMIDYLVGQAVIAMGLDRVRFVGLSPGAEPEALRGALQRLPHEHELRQVWITSMCTEFHTQKEMFRQTKNLEFPDVPLELPPPHNWMLKLFRDPLPVLKLNMTHNTVGAHFRELAFERIIRYAPPENEPEGLRGLAPEAGFINWARNPIGLIFAGMLKPAYDRIVALHFRGLADLRGTRLLLALRIYHIERGALPDTLDALAPDYLPEVPLDPFTERPFIYEPAGSPPLLLCAGPDQERDPDDERESDRDDIVVELEFAASDG